MDSKHEAKTENAEIKLLSRVTGYTRKNQIRYIKLGEN
jgi:hypothetical protein